MSPDPDGSPARTTDARVSIPHVRALDGLRGIAVAGVLLFHGGHLRGGYLGVDLFFTLSGFLITSLLLAESGRNERVSLRRFWARRARRLLPALVLMLVGVAVYSVAFASPQQLSQIRGDALATIGYVANWREIFSHQDYFALFQSPSPLNHTWSLAIEEQFYVIWPLAFVALLARFRRATPTAVLVTALALTAVSTTLMFAFVHDTTRAYFGTDTRASAILLGVALAAGLARRGPATARRARVAIELAALVAVVFLVFAWTRLDGESSTLYHGGFLAVGVAATIILAAVTNPEPGPLSRVLSWRPLGALGRVSYGVYLYHWPIDVAFDAQRMGFRGWPLLAFQTVLTLLVAYASYRFVEQPVRHGALTKLQWQRLTPAIAVALVAALVAATAGAQAQPKLTIVTAHPRLAATEAREAAPRGAPRIMVVGNSVANLVAEAMTKLHRTPPIAVLNASVPGCYFPQDFTALRISGVDNALGGPKHPPCHPDWEPDLIKIFEPDIVFWIMNDPFQGELRYRDGWTSPCSPTYDTLYRRDLRREIARLDARGAHVIVVTAPYGRYFDHAPDRYTDCDNAIRTTIADETHSQLIDLSGYICPAGKCREKQDGETLRPDGEHFEGAGARIVGDWLVDQIPAR